MCELSLMSISIAAIFVLFFGLIGVWLLYKKITTCIDISGKNTRLHLDNALSQIEALLAIYVDLKPSHALPATRGWAASPDFLRLLTKYVLEDKPSLIAECSSGVSTLVLASCLKKLGQGKVLSLEHDPEFAKATRAQLHLRGLDDWATVIDAPLKQLEISGWSGKWYDIKNFPENVAVDMLVIDGPPATTSPLARFPALPFFYEKLSKGGIVLLDDAARLEEAEAVNRWIIDYPDLRRVPYLVAEKGVAVLRKG